MMIGPLELPVGVVLVVGLPELVQAASTLAASTAKALLANAFLENQGRTGLTPSFSFLLVHCLPDPPLRIPPRAHGYTGRDRLLPRKRGETPCPRAVPIRASGGSSRPCGAGLR